MIIRALDSDHDWVFGYGKQSYKNNQDAIAENLQTRLLSFLNDCFFDMEAGVDWFELLSRKNTQNEIVLSCRAVILKTDGVIKINSLDASLLSSRELSISYNIDTIFTSQFTQSLQVP